MPLLRFVDAISVLKARPERFGSTSKIACRRKLAANSGKTRHLEKRAKRRRL
jgi:hypothetical protein